MSKVRELRERKGLTQVELAVAADVSLGTVQNAERRLDPVQVGTLRKIAKALGVRASVLIDE